MTMIRSFTVLALTGLVALPLVAGEKSKCPGPTDVCVTKMTENLRARGWVGIRLEIVEDGLIVKSVVPDSPASRAGLMADDKIVELNGIPYTEERRKDLKASYQDAMKPGKTIHYTVERGAERLVVPVHLVPIPEAVIAQWVGEHVIVAHSESEESEADADAEDSEKPGDR